MNTKTKKIIIIIVIIFVLSLLSWWLFDALNKIGKLKINVKVAPTDSQIVIDGKKSSAGDIYIKPGVHTFKASRSGFSDYSTTITIDETTVDPIILMPVPNSDAAYSLLKNNPTMQAARENLGSELADQDGKKMITKNPILNMLPFIDREYSITYEQSQKYPDDKFSIAIIITSTSDVTKQDALDYIKFKGYDASNLEIIYRRFPGY